MNMKSLLEDAREQLTDSTEGMLDDLQRRRNRETILDLTEAIEAEKVSAFSASTDSTPGSEKVPPPEDITTPPEEDVIGEVIIFLLGLTQHPLNIIETFLNLNGRASMHLTIEDVDIALTKIRGWTPKQLETLTDEDKIDIVSKVVEDVEGEQFDFFWNEIVKIVDNEY